MDAMKALQEANEEHIREQEQIQEEAKVEQERLQAEARAEQELLQDRLMLEIEASRIDMEEHTQTNEKLRKSLHRCSTTERSMNLSTRDNPKPFS